MTTPAFEEVGAASPRRRLDRVATWLLAAAAVAVVWAVWLAWPAWQVAEVGGYDCFAYPKELVAVALALPALALVVAGGGPARVERGDLLLAGSLALGVVSALTAATDPWLAWRSLAISFAAAAAFIAARALAARGRRMQLEVAVLAALGLAALAVIAEAHGLIALSMDGRAPGGPLGNRNYAAQLLVLGVPVVVAGATATERGWLRAAHRAALIAIVHAVVLSHCRGAWLALLAMAPYGAFLAWRGRGQRDGRRRILAALAAAGIGIASAALVPSGLRWSRDTHLVASFQRIAEYRSGTGRGRLIQYRNTLAMIGSAPLLGAGPGNWSVRYPTFSGPDDPSLQAEAVQPVNRLPSGDWLGFASERGAPALLLLVGFAALLVWRSRGPLADRRSAAVPAVVLAVAIMGSLDAVLQRADTALLLAIILGAIAPAASGPAGARPATTTAAPPARVGTHLRARVVAAAMIAAMAALLVRDRVRDVRALAARIEGLEARPPLAGLGALSTAAELDPGDYRIWAMLATLPSGCESRARHAAAALRLYPEHALARSVVDSCGTDVASFGQAQSWLEELGGDPLIAANWSGGAVRPYAYRGGQFVPLVADPRGLLAGIDLYRPVAIASDRILMAGQDAGRKAFDLYVLRLGDEVPVNITRTPDVDEGDVCARRGAGLVAYRAGRREVFARVGASRLEPIAAGAVPGLRTCAWLDDRRLVGIAGRAAPFQLIDCAVVPAAGTSPLAEIECHERQGAMREIVRAGDLVPGEGVATLSALARGQQFRGVFRIEGDRPELIAVPRPPDGGDLLDWTAAPAMWRTGHQSRYRSSLAPASQATIFTARGLGGRVAAIAADATTGRTLAFLDRGEWTLVPPPGRRAPRDIAPPEEVWTTSRAGERYQSFYFGPRDAARVVVWFHGGPHENVSPRFNAYFDALNHLGTAVLALNYPGSTGRGAAYEDRFADERALVDALESVWSELRRRGVSTIVSWSVSAGSRLPRVLLARGLPISAIVDQAGFDNADLVAAAARARVPLFAIRGRHDDFGPGTRIDFLYDGGHDITRSRDFAAMLAAVRPFLESARPIHWTGEL